MSDFLTAVLFVSFAVGALIVLYGAAWVLCELGEDAINWFGDWRRGVTKSQIKARRNRK